MRGGEKDGIRNPVIVVSTSCLVSWFPVRQGSGGAGLPRARPGAQRSGAAQLRAVVPGPLANLSNAK